MSSEPSPSLLVFGAGYVGARIASAWAAAGRVVAATSREPSRRARLAAQGVDPLDPADAAALGGWLSRGATLLVTSPPEPTGCPALAAVRGAGLAPRHAIYLSSTGVYGDRAGGWVFEQTPPDPRSDTGRRRLEAEQAWRGFAADAATALDILRLPGIYGPARSALDRVAAGSARRIVRAGQIFSRIHVDDIASAVEAAVRRPPDAGERILNICDDCPGPPEDVIVEAADLLGIEPPPAERYDPASLAPTARRFFEESKRVSNARAKAALGWRPAYRSYREGLRAILALDGEALAEAVRTRV